MTNSLSYDKTLMTSLETKIKVEKWKESLDAYKADQYKDSFLTLLDYIDSDIRKQYGNATETSFKIPHGSIIVEIEISETLLKIKAPFLKVGNTHKIPVFRRIAELNFSPLNLAQIRFNNNELDFYYEAPLDLCEPYKIYYVLEEICHKADNYDDEFKASFDVTSLYEPKVTPYNATDLEIIWNKFNGFIAEAYEYFEYFDKERLSFFNWDVINITLKKIDYCMSPQGKLRTDIEREISNLGSQDNINIRIQKGKQFLQTLQAIPKDELLENFYVAETFIPIKSRSEIEHLKKNLEHTLKIANDEIVKADFIGATFTLLLSFYDMLYYNMVPKEVAQKTQATLEQASKQPWKEASSILFKGMTAIMNEQELLFQTEQPKKKGFFSNLFK
ncbi:hypothetical protein [Flavobacterium sp. J27]|uniref:hypothetical protein n=1 Tax=Flavobacterium sp. J27 TaxID=2060419 RepID=UPI00102FE95C|nr:hypothetical protein [Flavobacterium sp. J27]